MRIYCILSRAEQSRAEQSRAEQSRAEQSRAEQSRAEQINLFFLAYANAIITGLQRARCTQQFSCVHRAFFRAPAHAARGGRP